MADEFAAAAPRRAAPGRIVWGVAPLLQALSDTLASRFSVCTVQGELSGFSRAGSGHCYFSLKDADGGDGLIRCAMFRRAASLLSFAPGDGHRVEVRGRLALYAPRGDLQFIVESMQPAGAGALYEQYLRLRARLEAEGLFDDSSKRPLAPFPRTVGVVTSLGAAALHDVVSSLARRAPHVSVIVYPTPVQGIDAPPAIVAALQRAWERREVDTLILCRGGGSLEDLWAFNDERVVRAVHASPIPVVCGVGHETDVSLCDFAADLRAPTPTAAAELATPATRDCQERLGAQAETLRRRLRQVLDTHAQRLDALGMRLSRPGEQVHRQTRRLDALGQRLAAARGRVAAEQTLRLERAQTRMAHAVERTLGISRHRLESLADRLGGNDPHRVLQRGYAWLSGADGRPVTGVAGLAVGDALRAVLHDGALHVGITGVDAATPI